MSIEENSITLINEATTAIRMRPMMYLQKSPSTQGVVNRLVEEAACHAIDEIASSYCSDVLITLHKNGSASVKENGNGIPVHTPEHREKSIAELYLTYLGACSGFKKNNLIGNSFCINGLVVTNALSENLLLETWVDGYRWSIRCHSGRVIEQLQKNESSSQTGSRITFLPDRSIFENILFDFEKLMEWASQIPQKLKDCSLLQDKCSIRLELIDERGHRKKNYSILIENKE